METLLIIVITIAAVWYLYRKFAGPVRKGGPSCGCGGCNACGSVSKTIEKQEPEELKRIIS
jgi:hypothetical protein